MSMDLREYWENPEEASRALLDGLRKQMWTAIPVIVNEDSPDGHTVSLKISIKGRQFDKDGKLSHVDFPLLKDVPIHFPQGGGVVHTYAVKKDDEGFVVFGSRPIDTWHQSGGVQQSIDPRTHSLSDAMFVPGHRSDPRKIQNVSNTSSHLRSDDGKHTIEQHPTNGTRIKTVDPSDTASNPFLNAKKFFEGIFHPTNGIAHNATDSGTTHAITNDHTNGPILSASNGSHSANVNPSSGISLKSSIKVLVQAAQHIINAPTTLSGGLSADSGNFSGGLSAGSLSAGSMSVTGGIGGANAPLAAGSASANIGALSGDLTGTLPGAKVTGLGNVDAHLLPKAASDAAAAALTPPVPIGGLYINQTSISGQNLLCVRMA